MQNPNTNTDANPNTNTDTKYKQLSIFDIQELQKKYPLPEYTTSDNLEFTDDTYRRSSAGLTFQNADGTVSLYKPSKKNINKPFFLEPTVQKEKPKYTTKNTLTKKLKAKCVKENSIKIKADKVGKEFSKLRDKKSKNISNLL